MSPNVPGPECQSGTLTLEELTTMAKTPTTSLRRDPDLRGELDTLAEHRGVTLADLIREACRGERGACP
jgi:hypothetical protein